MFISETINCRFLTLQNPHCGCYPDNFKIYSRIFNKELDDASPMKENAVNSINEKKKY
jgi:hypothetical protein